MNKQLFGLITAGVLACTSAPLTAFAEGETQDVSLKGKSPDGTYDYEVWNEYGQGEITFDGDEKDGGAFSCSWNDIRNCQITKGHEFEEAQTYDRLGDIECDYELEYSADGISQFGVTGWIVKNYTLIEYLIVEGYSEWAPPGDNYESLGQVRDHGITYDIYFVNRTEFDAPQNLCSYISVIREQDNQAETGEIKTISHTIDVDKHFKAWEAAGLDMSGTVKSVSFYVSGWECSGAANVTTNEITVDTEKPAGFQIKGLSPNGHYAYEVWNEEKAGEITYEGIRDNGGTFSCTWDNTINTIFQKGHNFSGDKSYTQLGALSSEYAIEFTPHGDAFFGMHGWATNCSGTYPTVEYFIVDGYSGEIPTGNAEPLASANIDGRRYDLYRIVCEDAPTILGFQTYYQYWSVISENTVEADTVNAFDRTISINDHFAAWEQAGMDLSGPLYDTAFFVEGRDSSGAATVAKNNIGIFNDTPQETTLPAELPERPQIPVFQYEGQSLDGSYDFGIWNENEQGEISFDCADRYNGEFSCTWDDTTFTIFREGRTIQALNQTYADLENIDCDYDIDISTDGPAFFGIHGWVESREADGYPYVEYYIIDGYTGWRPSGDAESLGKITDHGRTYDVYRILIGNPGTENCLWQYMSLIESQDNLFDSDGNASASISICAEKHFAAWEQAGMDLSGRIYDMAFTIEAFTTDPQKTVSGEADITKNDIQFNADRGDAVIITSAGDLLIRDTAENSMTYEAWNKENIGAVSLEGAKAADGSFSCKWDNTQDTAFSKGYILPGTRNYTYYPGLTCNYAIDYNAKHCTMFGMHGWFTNLQNDGTVAEYYIIDGYTEWTPTAINMDHEKTVMIDGHMYKIFRVYKAEAQTIFGTMPCYQYWSVLADGMLPDSQTASITRNISIYEHFKAWEDAGMDLSGNLAEVSFYISGFRSSGEANIKRNYIHTWSWGSPDIPETDPDSSVTIPNENRPETVTTVNKGDVDCSGTVDVADAVLLARMLAEDETVVISEKGLSNADCNGDGNRSHDDVILILKAIARLCTI